MPVPRVLLIGTFDAVHRGHRALIGEAARLGEPTIVSFHPHPRAVLRGEHVLPILPLEERIDHLYAAGAHVVAILPFSQEIAQQDYRTFTLERLRTTPFEILVLGPDHAFGRNREGNWTTLTALGKELGFEVVKTPPLLKENRMLSTSWIRQSLQEGRLQEAEELLGRPRVLWGRVQQGAGRGTPLGFPTANLALPTLQLPPHGVYAAEVFLAPQEQIPRDLPAPLPAVINFGPAPTVSRQEVILEAHLLNWSGSLLGSTIGVRFMHFLRGQERFKGLPELQQQLAVDCNIASDLLQKHAAAQKSLADIQQISQKNNDTMEG